MQTTRALVPLIASLLVVVLACAWLDALGSGPLSLVGKVVALAGLAGAGYSAIKLYSGRKDPYDLSTLWDAHPPEPEEPERESYNDDLVLCHRCGHSMPAHIGVCPECGSRLGH